MHHSTPLYTPAATWIRAILIDVDGTLTGRDGGVHPAVLPMLAAARARSVHLAVCTGRPGMGGALDLARLVEPRGFHIFCNGAAVVPLGLADASPHFSPLSDVSYARLVISARQRNLVLEVYTPDAVYIEVDDRAQARHTTLIGVGTTRCDLLDVRGPVLKVQWVVPVAAMPEVEAVTASILEVELGSGSHAEMPGVIFASVTPRGASKLGAARWLAERWGVALAQTAMIGDGDGDAELIAAAGVGIAMGNATSRTRAAARFVVADVDAGGLAEAIRLALDAAG